MIFVLLFSFLSGLVTIFAPCIWPLLPIVLSSTVTGGKKKPIGITLGLMLSFGASTLSLSYLVKIFSFDPEILRIFSVIIIGLMGITLITPKLAQIFESAVSRLVGKVSTINSTQGTGFKSGLITGLALGFIWTPCAGPILASIIVLAATQQLTLTVVFMTIAYTIGVGIPLFIFASLGTKIFSNTKFIGRHTAKIQQIFGVIMILTAVAIYTNYDKVLQTKLLDLFPGYSDFIYKLEGNNKIDQQLKQLKDTTPKTTSKNSYPPAPEFTGIEKWLNVEEQITMKDLKGKVVLVDFWTYTCINCIRTLPHVTNWYETYKDKGLVVIGVHTPEFEFEKNTQNVLSAIKQYKISYPVAQDNNYKTWYAYNNRYWPAHYLIDAEGKIRYTHFGEGKYKETEEKIVSLLNEAGYKAQRTENKIDDQTPKLRQTPETYLGINRMENFASKEEPSLGIRTYTSETNISVNYFSLEGMWKITPEYSQNFEEGAKLNLNFFANKVFLVISPKIQGDKVKVFLDENPIPTESAGADVTNSEIILDSERLYEIVNINGNKRNHLLRLEFINRETKVFAFTFGS